MLLKNKTSKTEDESAMNKHSVNLTPSEDIKWIQQYGPNKIKAIAGNPSTKEKVCGELSQTAIW